MVSNKNWTRNIKMPYGILHFSTDVIKKNHKSNRHSFDWLNLSLVSYIFHSWSILLHFKLSIVTVHNKKQTTIYPRKIHLIVQEILSLLVFTHCHQTKVNYIHIAWNCLSTNTTLHLLQITPNMLRYNWIILFYSRSLSMFSNWPWYLLLCTAASSWVTV